jgi:hypothetical protein
MNLIVPKGHGFDGHCAKTESENSCDESLEITRSIFNLNTARPSAATGAAYSITSSAATSKEDGRVRPSALAVLILTDNRIASVVRPEDQRASPHQELSSHNKLSDDKRLAEKCRN